jgi:hypothetical protein
LTLIQVAGEKAYLDKAIGRADRRLQHHLAAAGLHGRRPKQLAPRLRDSLQSA